MPSTFKTLRTITLIAFILAGIYFALTTSDAVLLKWLAIGTVLVFGAYSFILNLMLNWLIEYIGPAKLRDEKKS